jgi:hypothetical protein
MLYIPADFYERFGGTSSIFRMPFRWRRYVPPKQWHPPDYTVSHCPEDHTYSSFSVRVQTEQVGSNFYSVDAWFESRLEHNLS